MTTHRQNAFTFTEIMIVVAIIAIVAGISLPRMAKSENVKLTNAASIVVADIEFARFDAMTHSDDPCVIVFDLDIGRYHLARQSDVATPIYNVMTDSPYVREFGRSTLRGFDGVVVSAASVGPDAQLGFGPLGELDQISPATIRLECKGRSLLITLDPVIADSIISEIE